MLVVLDGEGELAAAAASRCRCSRGDAVLVPWSAGPAELHGDVVAIACRPPEQEVT